jgi:hypothetical protein
MPGLKDVEIFSIGKWRGNRTVDVNSEMLDRMVSNFANLNSKVTGFAVPGKLGHNSRIGEPAMGWVSDVRRVGNKLVADFADVPDDVVDKIGKRQYNAVSVEVWPTVEFEGQTFNDVLGAVAFLGSEWPAVKGLKPLSASLFTQGAGEWIEKETNVPQTFTEDQHTTLITAAVATAKAETAATFQSQLTVANKRATDESERADRAEAALKVFRDDQAKATVLTVVEKAIEDGRILPKQKDEIMAMAQSFGVMSATKFKVGDTEKTGLEMFQGFMEGLPIKVQYTERGRSKSQKPGSGARADVQLDAAAKSLMSRDNKLTYAQAVEQALAANPALKAEYSAQRENGSNSEDDQE